ncbi:MULTISPECIES: ester cyclase [Streptomyces]|uniref:Nuclear transport factor 2 family protein n=1 Tax=Streptomyces caniscabiei TaxID=2746961 RepID=A0ABU4N324_9ACTN|nr:MULTISPECIES: nuclear transport factor 2 family protein [Streptomyces]MBE4736832.1 nuclear transport factor 2 family protein [Streptomyces caniscabiei]MBE4762085.1 nuclear transport factor 2 family protein [Streptomyces caniscabiei]MBE4775404.1 nuclear transport factor 2 family protein [Streptomyces caniscabiei]MBE4787051.1 nuclear transport factor 2 family protein [Streptomyces caniscabiei]MBE4794694.1 nuclear transport factor 2 family protein [Streptomyces caniscabiei]
MGQARELMDQLTEALTTHQDPKTVANLFAEDAVAHTPDGGELHGRDAIAEYWQQMTDAMPEARYESLASFEVGDTAIDEGVFSGTNTGPLAFPDGTSMPATHKDISMRGVDFATVRDGQIVSYRLYFDQLDFLNQLGLLPEEMAQPS